MNVNFYKYAGANNVINKNLGEPTLINCNMEVATTQINPTVRVTFEDVTAPSSLDYNYCVVTLGDVNYPYFIDLNNVVNIGKGVFNVPMTLDLLEFYKSKILDSTAIIERSATTYNMYLQDNMYNAYGYPILGCKVFPSGVSDNYTYLLNVCNSIGG